MSAHETHHLTADELDGLLDGNTVARIASHLETCTLCRTMVELDHRVVVALSALPAFDPTAGFADRVMHRVTLHRPPVEIAVVVSPRERAARRRVAVAALIAGGTVATGFAWAAANPADAFSWSSPALQGVGQTVWASIQAVAANASEQPWFSGLRDTLVSPARVLPALIIVAGVYAAALVGLRRLLAEPAADAGW